MTEENLTLTRVSSGDRLPHVFKSKSQSAEIANAHWINHSRQTNIRKKKVLRTIFGLVFDQNQNRWSRRFHYKVIQSFIVDMNLLQNLWNRLHSYWGTACSATDTIYTLKQHYTSAVHGPLTVWRLERHFDRSPTFDPNKLGCKYIPGPVVLSRWWRTLYRRLVTPSHNLLSTKCTWPGTALPYCLIGELLFLFSFSFSSFEIGLLNG